MSLPLSEINALSREEFVAVVGPVFEHSPWIAALTWKERPFASIEELHAQLCRTVRDSGQDPQLALLRAHPDLVGRATLTAESTREQTAAGLMNLTAEEVVLFQKYNTEYKDRFGFPFVICARLNKKATMLEAFPKRLDNDDATELATALTEIEKIAELRLRDLLA